MNKLIAAAVLGLFSTSLWAADCAVTIDSTDAMQFSTKTMEVPASCKDFTVKLTHSGKMAKNVMGHNWVLSLASDQAAVNSDGMKAGLDNNYLKPDDSRVIAHTKVIGGGESDSVTFPVSKLKAGEAYAFFCSFPGHAGLMKGTLSLVQ